MTGRPPTSGRGPWPLRLVFRFAESYAPVAVTALGLAVVGSLFGRDWSELPLVILTLPLSAALFILGLSSPAVTIPVCGLLAVGIWASLRRSRTVGSDGLIACVVVLWFVVSAFSAFLFIRSQWFGNWPRIREAVASYEVPPGFEVVARSEAGTEACFISCVEPQIALVLATTLAPAEACRAIEASIGRVAENVGPAPGYLVEPPGAACFLQGELPELHPRARLIAAVLNGSDLASQFWLLAGADRESFAGAETVAALLFNNPNG